MARNDPPDYGANDPTAYGNHGYGGNIGPEPEPEPVPGWRKPIGLVAIGLLIAVLIGLIIFGILELMHGPDPKSTTPTTSTTTVTVTTTLSTSPTTTTSITTPTTTPATTEQDHHHRADHDPHHRDDDDTTGLPGIVDTPPSFAGDPLTRTRPNRLND